MVPEHALRAHTLPWCTTTRLAPPTVIPVVENTSPLTTRSPGVPVVTSVSFLELPSASSAASELLLPGEPEPGCGQKSTATVPASPGYCSVDVGQGRPVSSAAVG